MTLSFLLSPSIRYKLSIIRVFFTQIGTKQPRSHWGWMGAWEKSFSASQCNINVFSSEDRQWGQLFVEQWRSVGAYYNCALQIVSPISVTQCTVSVQRALESGWRGDTVALKRRERKGNFWHEPGTNSLPDSREHTISLTLAFLWSS